MELLRQLDPTAAPPGDNSTTNCSRVGLTVLSLNLSHITLELGADRT